MPLATNPDALFTVVLESDQHLPAAEQPKFIYRYLTGLEWQEVARVQDTLEDVEDSSQLCNKIFETAATKLVGWTNIYDVNGAPILFDPKKMPEFLGILEAQELIKRLMSQHPDLDDKKKFDSASPSGTGKSAKTAKAGKNARTNPAQPAP